ncbi:hypothetical protein [Streptomyces sp. NPDC058632]|uniref:hypothetical protein n=1 Tax=unclassified Streptomyces TaxID=2593676 RepID=UPI00365205AD
MFITIPDFLPQHRQHLSDILQIITAVEALGQQRLVELNTWVLDNLDTTLTSDAPDSPKDIADTG